MRKAVLAVVLIASLAGCVSSYGYEVSGSRVTWNEPNARFLPTPGVTGYELEGADASTFVVVSEDGFFGKDSRRVYYRSFVLEGANAATWRILGNSNYSTDGASVFYMYLRVAGADVATFRVTDEVLGCAQDALRSYRYAEPGNC